MTISVKTEITDQQLKDLLCNAFEGGSNYWIEKVIRKEDGPRAEYIFEVPFTKGNSVKIYDEDGKEFTLDLSAIEKGIQIMNDKYPHHMRDFIEDNADACTGDVYLQCCLFGEAVYG